MALSSMTGFARGQGSAGARMAGRGKSGRSMPRASTCGCGCRRAGTRSSRPVRARAGEVLARGTLHATLNVEREGAAPVVKVNEDVLKAVIATLNSLAGRVEAQPPRLDGILAIKGVIEVADAAESEAERTAAQAVVIKGFDAALAELTKMRRHEGEALGRVLMARLDEILALVARAEASPGRKPDAIGRGSPNRSPSCSMRPSASTPTGCTRRRS